MADDQQLSAEDLAAIQKVRASLSSDDPRGSRIDKFLISQKASRPPETPPSNPAIQSKQELMAKMSGLTRDTGRYPRGLDVPKDRQSTQIQSMLSSMAGVPDTSQITPSQAKTGIATGALVGGGAAAPAATALGLAGSVIGDPLAKATATAVGASPGAAEMWGTTGGIIGGLAGGKAGSQIDTPFLKWLSSSRSVGAQALQAASAKAGNAPVELSPRTDELVDKIVQQGGSGGHTPKVITDLLKRLGPAPGQAADAVPGPLTYDEARLFQQHLSELSVSEHNALTKAEQGLVKQLAKSFAGDVQKGANAAGAGPEHAIGMKEYAAASARGRAIAAIGKAAAPVGGTLYGISQIRKFIKETKR